MEVPVKRRAQAVAITFLVAGATLLIPASGVAQGRFYDPFYFNPFYFDPYYHWYPPAYGYGGVFDREASLRLEVTPREAEGFVDGYFAGQAKDFDGFLKRLRLPPGEHTIQLYFSGYRLVEQKVYLQPGATFRVRYNMERLAPGEPAPERPAAPVAAAPPSAAAAPP